MSWIEDWLANRSLGLSKTWLFGYPDASKDKCLRCAVARWVHPKDHPFEERR